MTRHRSAGPPQLPLPSDLPSPSPLPATPPLPQDLALHPTHRLLATALESGTVQLHVYDDASGGLQLWPSHSLCPFALAQLPACTAIAFLADSLGGAIEAGSGGSGGAVVVGSEAGALHAADTATGLQVWHHDGEHSGGARVKCIAGLDAHTLASGGLGARRLQWHPSLCCTGATAVLHLPCCRLPVTPPPDASPAPGRRQQGPCAPLGPAPPRAGVQPAPARRRHFRPVPGRWTGGGGWRAGAGSLLNLPAGFFASAAPKPQAFPSATLPAAGCSDGVLRQRHRGRHAVHAQPAPALQHPGAPPAPAACCNAV